MQFAFDKSQLLPESFPELDSLVAVLKFFPELHIEITGHTDRVGSLSYNQTLSTKRAASVQDYLEASGIASERITAIGKGSTTPLSKTDRTKNRRVTFRLTDKTP